jgi:predicted aspartyl protease
MSFRFDPGGGLMVVQAEASGPQGSAILRLALDTGATTTLINVAVLVALGYDPSSAPDRMQVTTGSGVEYMPVLHVRRIRALGHARRDMPVLAHTLPTSASVDGLLGVDFLRGKRLTVDFKAGRISLR